ncbi:MAG TPA: NAD(P)H-dependent oxidoreductase [Candidatus Sphingobacterium stercoripullorum]|nr:NAD(P)H-dependent oxidoreductase [Candidatus Sphingobacterium stercoripullorum]
MGYKIAALVGSLRKDSLNRKTAENIIRLLPDNLKMEFVEIGHLPYYNEDLETDSPPESWTNFRDEIRQYDAVFLFSPEYNRSVSAVLKNALDVGSRPYGKSVWDGKPAAIATASISGIGGAVANHTLRQSLVFLNMPVMQQPEIYLGNAQELFDDSGRATEKFKGFLKQVIAAYEKWIHQILK